MKKATYYEAGKEPAEVSPKNGSDFSLEELQAFVAGIDRKSGRTRNRIETVSLGDGRVVVVNEEGLLMGLPKNEGLTKVWHEAYPPRDFPLNNPNDLVGNGLVCPIELIK